MAKIPFETKLATLCGRRHMGEKSNYLFGLRCLHRICQMARKLEKVPIDCLQVKGDDIADAEYVTEWLDIVLCRICGQADISMLAFDEGASLGQQFRWFIQKAARQARAIRRGLFFGRIEKSLFAEKAWDGLDSAESFLASFLSENVYWERRRRR